MIGEHRLAAERRLRYAVAALGWLVVLAGTAGCGHAESGPGFPRTATLRVGVGDLPQGGRRQFNANFSIEGLVNLTDDGRPREWLAEGWSVSADGRTLVVRLRPKAVFHDGSPVTSRVVADILRVALPRALGPVFEDVDTIEPSSPTDVSLHLKRASPFVLESLETGVEKPASDGIGTGPFAPDKGNETGLHAFEAYYLGRPLIEQISVTPYPSVRAAWAELLRGNLDMLLDVSNDALDSLQGSSNVAVFSFVRHYQYTITFGGGAKGLELPQVRRELNAAIDRRGLIETALRGHGRPSTGPVPPEHWAFDSSAPRLHFDATLAKKLAARHLVFTCLVPADSEYERIALAVKQQLAMAGVDMRLQEVTQQEFSDAVREGHFEAALVDPISGPSLFRAYRQFYSTVAFAPKPRASAVVDAALDRIRHAASDDDYRAGVMAFQQAIVDDPPALFLAWGERARAVSRRFEVPAPEGGHDVLATLRLWRPATVPNTATGN